MLGLSEAADAGAVLTCLTSRLASGKEEDATAADAARLCVRVMDRVRPQAEGSTWLFRQIGLVPDCPYKASWRAAAVVLFEPSAEGGGRGAGTCLKVAPLRCRAKKAPVRRPKRKVRRRAGRSSCTQCTGQRKPQSSVRIPSLKSPSNSMGGTPNILEPANGQAHPRLYGSRT